MHRINALSNCTEIRLNFHAAFFPKAIYRLPNLRYNIYIIKTGGDNMMKKIMAELTEQYGEQFGCEIFPDRYEFYSENHLYVYYRKSGQLVKNF